MEVVGYLGNERWGGQGQVLIKGYKESPAPGSRVITSLHSLWPPSNAVREAPALGHGDRGNTQTDLDRERRGSQPHSAQGEQTQKERHAEAATPEQTPKEKE